MEQYDTLDILFPSSLVVTGQQIDLSYLTQSQQNFYKDIFKELINVYASKNQPRVVIGLAGPTGSGKSLLVALLQEFAKQIALPFRLQTLGIDAFHYPNAYLETQTDADGTVLSRVKGRFDTYDVPRLITALCEFEAGKTVSLPEYSRITHNPIENVTTISEANVLLIVEGLWLFYAENGWKEIAPRLNYKVFIEADAESVNANVVHRHERGGKSKDDAERYYATVDVFNSRLVMQTRNRADKIIPAYYKVA